MKLEEKNIFKYFGLLGGHVNRKSSLLSLSLLTHIRTGERRTPPGRESAVCGQLVDTESEPR